MKPYKTLVVAAALTLGTSLAMAQNTMGPSATQSATQSDQNKSVGDGSSGGPNVGVKDKTGAATNAAPLAGTSTGAKANTNEAAKVGVDKEGKTGDAVTTTGSGQMNQKKQ